MKWVYFLLVFVPVKSFYPNSTENTANFISSPCTDKNHFFLTPGVLTAGGTNRACVSRFHPEGSARMLLSLVSEDKMTNTASRDLLPGDGGCLDISVPLLPNTKADLVVNIWYPEAKCTWERKVSLRISSGRVVVVHTERARYRPGDTLRARVFALKADLTPAPGIVEEIWIEGPAGAWEGVRVAQWTKVRSKMGLAQVQHDIDELAPPGRWTVRARLGDGSQGSAVFWVGNYELPPFQLTVRHAPRVLRTSERLAWTVCVRYPWTEAVEGMLVIRLRGAGAGAGSESGGIRTAVRLRAPRACHRHAAAARRVGLAGDRPPDVLVADFSFQEEGTRVWQNTTVVSQVVDKPVSLEFLTKPHTVISPGLPYKLKVKAIRWDEKPVSGEKIRVCRYGAQTSNEVENKPGTCIGGDTDGTGVARIVFPAEDDASPFYRFEASLFNDSTTRTAPLTLATRRSPIQAALGPLRADSKGTRTFVPLYLNLQNVTTPVTVHFVVITRGGIIYRWGATTQCPIASSATIIQTAARNSKCNDPMAQYEHEKNNNQPDNKNKQDSNNINQTDNNKDTNKADNNESKTAKTARNYDININLYINQNNNYNINYPNKTNTRNMNQHDKNNYLHKMDKHEPNNPVYDKFSPVLVKPTVFVKVDNTNSVQYEMNASDALLDRHLLRVMLPIKVTQQMCPDSHLIAYFYYNGEFVSASKHFEMDDCFINKVEATFLSRQALPGSPTTLQLTTPGPALCALTALDSAARWGRSYAVKDVLMTGLKRMIDGHRNVTEYDAAGDCFMTAESPPLPTDSVELTATWLAAAGVRTLGDIPLRRSCDSPASLIDEGTVPRSDFSEAWLWRLVTVGSNGSAVTTAQAPDSITRYEANAVCLSKTGIAISPTAFLQVFREFFIHADGPKRLRRGDSTIVRYRLFNYLYEPLSVQIQIVASSGLQAPSAVVESACIPARASTARRLALTARSAGEARLTIRAKAVSDGGCGNYTYSTRGVSDEVIMTILVEPEGVPVREHKSMLLCGKDNSNSTSSRVSWSFSTAKIIPGTETLTVWATGDIIGPLIADADSLVLLPRGCGEQNMARLATNLLALKHLHPHSAAALAAKEHVARGFTRQLQYIHPSGGFSAFGPTDVTSSTWLTAFSLRYLRRAHKQLYPNQPLPPVLEAAERWLLNQQMENGCFRNEGQVFHRELRGGLNEEDEIASVALTAYVVTSLLESTSPLPLSCVRNSLSCLRALPPVKYSPPARVYAHALLAYAFIRINKYEEDIRRTNEARYEDLRFKPKPNERRDPLEVAPLQKTGIKGHEGLLEVMQLIKMATREGEYLWWETGSLSTSIEATSYALLALRESPSALREFGSDAVRWLNAHRGPSGGFVSTQDTLVALEALSAWYSLQPSPSNLTVSAHSGPVSRLARLDPTVRIPEVLNMGTGDQISIGVEGSGCALVQATRSYHTPSSGRSQHQLAVELTLHTDGTFDCDSADNCYCAAIVEACVVWSGRFPEMALLEVSLPGGYVADAARLYAQLDQPDTLVRRIELSPSGSRATLYLASRAGAGALPRRGHACFSVHSVGPRGRTRPAYVRLLDYYTPAVNDTQIYTIPEECPSRVTHDNSQEMTSDNLYSKARSLADKGEILISHEFTFEDIPEGIPLEDPLYENLTRKDKDKNELRRKADVNYTKHVEDATIENNISIRNDTDLNDRMDIKNSRDTKISNISVTDVNFSSNSMQPHNVSMTAVNNGLNGNTSNLINNGMISETVPNNNHNINNNANLSYISNESDNRGNDNTHSSSNIAVTETNYHSDMMKSNDQLKQNDHNSVKEKLHAETFNRYPAYRNPLPYIPNQWNNNEELQPFKNIVLPKVETNNKIHAPVKIDDKLDLHNLKHSNKPNVIIIPTSTNKVVKVSFTSEGKQVDVFYNDKQNEAKMDTETSTNDFKGFTTDPQEKPRSTIKAAISIKDYSHTHQDKEVTTHIDHEKSTPMTTEATLTKHDSRYSYIKEAIMPIHHEHQRSISTEPTSVKYDSKLSNDANDNENKVDQKIQNSNDYKDRPFVDNPKLSAFHVIDSAKDLEVPSGIEGPVPSIVLPPLNFVPPQIYPENVKPLKSVSNFNPRVSEPSLFTLQNSMLVPPVESANNYVRTFIPNNAPRQHNVPKDFNVQNNLPNNFVPQNVVTFDPQKRLSSFAPQNYVSTHFAPTYSQNTPYAISPPSQEMVPPAAESSRHNDFYSDHTNPYYLRRTG